MHGGNLHISYLSFFFLHSSQQQLPLTHSSHSQPQHGHLLFFAFSIFCHPLIGLIMHPFVLLLLTTVTCNGQQTLFYKEIVQIGVVYPPGT